MTLNSLRDLPDNWSLDGAAKPNDAAIQNANKILEAINRKPSELRPSVDAGVYIQYRQGHLSVFVECYNDGEIGYTLLQNRKPVKSRDMFAENMSALDFISDIQNYLGHSENLLSLG